YLTACDLEIAIQRALEVPFDRQRQRRRVIRRADEARLTVYNVVAERSYVRRHGREPKAERQKENSALEDAGIRKNQHVGRLEVHLQIRFGNVVDTPDRGFPCALLPEALLHRAPIRFVPLL